MKRIVLLCLLIVASGSAALAQNTQEKLPAGVFFVSEKTEDIIDLYVKKDWIGAQGLVTEISHHQEEVEREMRRQHLPDATSDLFGYLMYRLQDISREKQQPITAALTANQITALLIDLQRFYFQKTPLEIARLDYLGREVVLLAQVPNTYGLLGRRISELAETWDRFKPDSQALKAPKGEEVAAHVDQVVAALKRGTSKDQLVKSGKTILDLVDRLEALYK
jgi:hypothetical protein